MPGTKAESGQKRCFCFHCTEVTKCDPVPPSGCLLGLQEPPDLGFSTEMGMVFFREKEGKKENRKFLFPLNPYGGPYIHPMYLIGCEIHMLCMKKDPLFFSLESFDHQGLSKEHLNYITTNNIKSDF